MNIYEAIIILLNLFAFSLMFYDKRQARRHQYRVPEKILLAFALIGGSAGIWLGMKAFRHKTKHAIFYYGVPVIICLQVALLLYLTQR